MIKKCKQCLAEFEITQEDLNFYDKISPIFNWVKYGVPEPTHCPDCRQQRRLTWRNERKLYKRRCNATEKNIISMYSPDKPYKVYSQEEWWSDKWDAKDYWMEFDFNKSFFEQFRQLELRVPFISLLNSRNENSIYTNFSEQEKNCYLVFASNRNQDCAYCSYIWDSKNCVDCFWVQKSQTLYQCVDCINCYNTFYSEKCYNSNDVFYSYDCKSCKDIFACIWLRNKSYCILNKQYSKDEYKKRISELNIKSVLSEFNKIKLNYPRMYSDIINSENSSWSYLNWCQNCNYCFDSFWLQDAKYVENSPWNSKDVYDISWCANTEVACELVSIANWYNIFACLYSHIWLKNSFYCISCINSSDLFACKWLKNAKYCILNKQYTKQEYEKIMPKIIEHMKKTKEWWEFFPVELSPFAYNETVAQEYFPMTKEEVLKEGWLWKDEEDSPSQVLKIISAEKLPNSIKDIPDDILAWAIKCINTWKPFRVIPQELEFYRKHNIPIPHLHPEQRHLERIKLRNANKLYLRKCLKCEKEIQSTYAPNRPEIVYCEECYLKEVY